MAEMTTPNIFTMPQTGGNNDMGMGAITLQKRKLS
jgi:hypothetical protein